MPHTTLRSASGFTLLETIVATGILVMLLAGVAQLFVLSSRLTDNSGRRSSAAFAAQTKMESLLARAFTYSSEGDPITDPAIEPSPPGSLVESIEGFEESLDADGHIIPADEATAAVFVRRWAVTPLDDLTPEAFVIEVCVFRAPAEDVPVTAAESCLATVKARQP